MTDTETDTPQDKTVTKVVIGAWREAIGESGFKRVILVGIVAVMTIPFAPVWVLLAALEKLGVYNVG